MNDYSALKPRLCSAEVHYVSTLGDVIADLVFWARMRDEAAERAVHAMRVVIIAEFAQLPR